MRTDTENDLVDHPAWQDLTGAHAHNLNPAEDNQFDLVVVEELLAEKPTAGGGHAGHAGGGRVRRRGSRRTR
ncbi:Uncharacterised protein [Mycobacterium tuberculosis]|nr:Uncharacterised protein [Mycobacterium tuberculosis]